MGVFACDVKPATIEQNLSILVHRVQKNTAKKRHNKLPQHKSSIDLIVRSLPGDLSFCFQKDVHFIWKEN